MKHPESKQSALLSLPSKPSAGNELTFAEPWQAEVFAMTLSLHERGLFTWKEWADRLANEISKAQAVGDPDLGDTYYHHWLRTFENLVVEKGILDQQALVARHDAWDRSARATLHGEPIVLNCKF